MGFTLGQQLQVAGWVFARHSAAAVFRRHQIGFQIFREVRLQRQNDGILLPQICFGQSHLIFPLGVHQQIAGAGQKPGKAILIGGGFPKGEQLAVIDDLKPHLGPG